MLAKQLSVFLENKSGRLTEVTEVLGEAGINLTMMNIADNSDFGILRCIVSDPERALQVLRERHFAVKVTDVIAFSCPNASGALSRVLKLMSDAGVFIEYLYSFNSGDVAHIVIRPTDLGTCEQVLSQAGVSVLSAGELYKI
ncbi:MAG: ACT domain-containing protein [Prevotella sp.]|nr:ACT domain-containing protein [Prevotella sp.]